jgi:hypothetical protein
MVVIMALALVPALLAAQANSPLPKGAPKGAPTITAANIARHLDVLRADSLLGRDTPSHELEMTAQYVTQELQKFGLAPYGDHGQHAANRSWLQRYPLPGHLKVDYQRTFLRFGVGNPYFYVSFLHGGKETDPKTHVRLSFSGGARFAADTIPASAASDVGLPTYLVAGPYTKASLQQTIAGLLLQETVVLYVPPAGLDSAVQRELIDQIARFNPVVVLAAEDGPAAAERRNTAVERPLYVVDEYMEKNLGQKSWVVAVPADSVAKLLLAAGIDLTQVRGSPTPLVREVRGLDVTLQLRTVRAETTPPTAPNVGAILWGTDRNLWRQQIVLTAHMDRRGATGDNAPGVAALLELARAFSQPEARPRQSLLFLVTSGSERNFLGSSFWTHALRGAAVGMAINLDNVGRDASGVVAIDGLSDFEFAKPPGWIAAEHPELGLKLVDGGSVANAASDHVSFVRNALPALYVHDPVPAESAASAESAAGAVNLDQLARVAQLVFYLGQELGNAKSPPRWSATGRQRRAILSGRE